MTLASTSRPRPHLVGEIVIVLILVKGYDYVRSFASTRAGLAARVGEGLLHLERRLHILVEPRTNHWLARHSVFETLAASWYQYAHLTVTLSVVAWLYWRHSESYRQARNALVLTNVVGLIVFVVLPVMPPRLLPDGGFVDAVAAAGLGNSPKGPVAADEYAAMPSLHLAWATWTAIVGVTVAVGVWRWLWLAYPLVTTLVVVSTGNHYLLDAVAGTLVALAAATVTGLLPWRPRLRKLSGVPGALAHATPDNVTSDDPATYEYAEDERARDQRHPDGDQPVGHDGPEGERSRSAASDEASRESDVEGAETAR
jgi:hypothetical protein